MQTNFYNLDDVQKEINRLGDRRYNLWRQLNAEIESHQYNEVLAKTDSRVKEIHRITDELASLWPVARSFCTDYTPQFLSFPRERRFN
jgi:hypothetical protein